MAYLPLFSSLTFVVHIGELTVNLFIGFGHVIIAVKKINDDSYTYQHNNDIGYDYLAELGLRKKYGIPYIVHTVFHFPDYIAIRDGSKIGGVVIVTLRFKQHFIMIRRDHTVRYDRSARAKGYHVALGDLLTRLRLHNDKRPHRVSRLHAAGQYTKEFETKERRDTNRDHSKKHEKT